MGIISIDGNFLKKMIISGSNKLNKNKQLIDSLNVFPVPDGDTGLNMASTIISAAKEVVILNNPNIYDVAIAASKGALKGARGNSGVITSQLFRGFAKSLQGKDLANVEDLVEAFKISQITAYKAVMKPKEGTILTIARILYEKAEEIELQTKDIYDFFNKIVDNANQALKQTTVMLEELRKADVVDAGGKGWIVFWEGALEAFDAKEDIVLEEKIQDTEIKNFNDLDTCNIKYIYCTEFIVKLDNFDSNLTENMKKYLDLLGDSIVVFVDENLMKVHVHTNNPGKIIEKALKHGSISNVKIENMKDQHTSLIDFNTNNLDDEYKIVCVLNEDGFDEVLKSLNVYDIIKFHKNIKLTAQKVSENLKQIKAKNIFLISNVISKKDILNYDAKDNLTILELETIPEIISALIAFSSEADVQSNLEAMNNAAKNIITACVTKRKKVQKYVNLENLQGNIVGFIKNQDFVLCSDELQNNIQKVIEKCMEFDKNYMCIYCGDSIDDQSITNLASFLEQNFPKKEVDIIKSNHLDYYILSLE